MKRRFLALAMALVMVVGLLPASILTANAITIDVDDVKYDIQESVVDLTATFGTPLGSAITIDAETNTATVTQSQFDTDSTESGGQQHNLFKKNYFAATGEEFITQDIEIISMPIFGESAYTISNSRVATGYYTFMTKNYDGASPYDCFMISIYRVNEDGDLYLAVGAAGSFAGNLHALNKQVGDRFKLMAHLKEGGKLDVYCDDELVYTSGETAVTYENGNGNANLTFRIGYNSTGATAPESGSTATNIKLYSVTKGTKVEHVHKGGTATCSTKANCSDCGAQYGDFGLHVPGNDGKCTLCQAEGFIDYTTYTIVETPINLSATFGTPVGSSVTINAETNTATVNQAAGSADAATEAGAHYLTKKSQSSPGEKIFSQDIEIVKMPVFNTYAVYQSRVATGYFMLVGNDADGASPYEVTMISIYRVDDEGNLSLGVSSANTPNTGLLDLHPLGKKVGDRFKLMAVYKEDGKLDVYCDGELVVNTTVSVEYTNTKTDIMNALRIGYNSYGAVAPTGGDTAALINIHSVNTVTKQAHEHSGGKATCSTRAVCATCGQEYGEADGLHTPGNDGKCTGCGVGGFIDYTAYDVVETPIDFSTFTKAGSSMTVGTDTTTATVIQAAMDTGNKDDGTNHYLTKKSFAAAGEKIYSQDIRINNMPIFTSYAMAQSRVANGLYMLVGNDANDDTSYECTVISIYRVDEEGNLSVAIADSGYTFAATLHPLGVKVGQRFKLMAVFKEDGKLDIYCNGNLVFNSTESVEYTNTQNVTWNALRYGYNSTGATAPANGDASTNIEIFSVNVVTKEVHEHSGGKATCNKLAVCAACGEEYGEYGLHTPGRDGKCTECGLGGFIDYVTYNVTENPINLNNLETKVGAALQIGNDGFTATITQDAFDTIGKEANTHYVSQKAFASPGEKIYSQDIEILKMPIFNTRSVYQSRSANGYYMVVGNDADAETPYELTIISIYRIDEDGNLVLGIADIANYTFRSTLYPLGKTLGQRFKLTTVFKEDGKLDVYCDGTLVCSTTESVEYTNSTDTICNALRIGYSSYQATAPESGDTSTLINIYSLNEVTKELHVHAPVEDDFNCTTGYTCTCGTEIAGEADHARPEDDGNCATDIVCSNPGCNVVLEEGHTLTHVDRVEPDGATPGMKEHWYCQTDDAYFADEAGTQKVNREDLIISSVVDVEDGKATVKDEFADVVTGSEGQVELEVPTASGVELPAAVLDALQTKGQPLVITTSGGKVTLNQDFLAAIKNTTGDSGSLFVEVKAGATLESAQETELAKKGTVKEVISAEMLAGGADLHDFTGTVTIEIPFELAPNTTANDYQLWYVNDNGTSSKQIEATFADGKMTATLEHFSNYAIVTTATQPVQGNGTITSNGGSATATVTGTYVDGAASGDVFSVDVEWENLSFNYMAANTWDPETHTNTGGGWEENVTGNVTVVNHSNIAITVTVTKEDIGGEKGLGVNFLGATTDDLDAGTTENTGDLADKFMVEFAPKGTLEEGDTDVTLATITVTIAKYVPQN